MKTAAVSSSFNEYDLLDSFRRRVDEYHAEIDWHIIVDNLSDDRYRELLRKTFPDSIILERFSNGGTTAAFNDGIKYALAEGAEAVLLITQDIRLPADSLMELKNLLASRPKAGIVGPVLLKPDMKTIEEFGGTINQRTLEITKNYAGRLINDDLPEEMKVDFIAGGMNLTRREVFEQIGLQDESLFMYCDELDFDYRAKKTGWELITTQRAKAVHEHPGEASFFKPYSLFLMTRNHLWVVRKHLGRSATLRVALSKLKKFPRFTAGMVKHGRAMTALAYGWGIVKGLSG